MSEQELPYRNNYLTRIAKEQNQRRWPRRECDLIVRILFPRSGLREVSIAQLHLSNISEGGVLATSRLEDVPDHFYICLGDFQRFLGASVVGRQAPYLHVSFIKEQPTAFVDIAAAIIDPFELLKPIRPALYGLDPY